MTSLSILRGEQLGTFWAGGRMTPAIVAACLRGKDQSTCCKHASSRVSWLDLDSEKAMSCWYWAPTAERRRRAFETSMDEARNTSMRNRIFGGEKHEKRRRHKRDRKAARLGWSLASIPGSRAGATNCSSCVFIASSTSPLLLPARSGCCSIDENTIRMLLSLQDRLVIRIAPPSLAQSLSLSDQPPMRISLFGGNLKRMFVRLAGLAW
jgi:hypothetical protein